jgi:hypothetical protein
MPRTKAPGSNFMACNKFRGEIKFVGVVIQGYKSRIIMSSEYFVKLDHFEGPLPSPAPYPGA